MYYVVQLDSNIFKEKIVVPSIWLDKYNTLCLLPPVTDVADVETLAKAQSTPKHGWQMHNVTFIQSFDTYSEAKESIKKGKPVMIELEEEEEEHKEVRGKRKRKLPLFLEHYSIESDDDEEEDHGMTQNECTVVANVVPDPSIVKIETMEDSNAREYHQQPRLNATHNKSSSLVHSSLQHDSQLQAAGSSSSTISSSNVKLATKCPCNSSCHKVMLRSIAALQRQVEDSNRLLHQIMGHLTTQGGICALPAAPPGFPVTLPIEELSDLHSFDMYLNEEPNFTEAIPYFTCLGGDTPRQILKRIMEAFVSKELSTKLNWKGRGDKDPFNTYTKIHRLVYHIAKQNPKAAYITLAEVETFIKDWLKMAPIRTLRGPKKSLNQSDTILRC